MKIIVRSFFKHKKYLFSLLLVLYAVIFISKPVYSQIDYSYGLNKKGFRFSLGLGGNAIQTTWSTTPVNPTIVTGLSYDFSHYFSFGLEGQFGSMVGIDGTNTFAYSRSENSYSTASANLRFSLGLLNDFESPNGFCDAIKRGYIGIGYGVIFSNVKLTQSSNAGSVGGVTLTPDNSGKVQNNVFLIPFNIGTNIGLPGVWGSDKVELNPNIQYSIFKGALVDGYQPRANSTNGGYVLISVSLRYKF